MVVGGIANIVWGIERATFDIDITIWIEQRYEGIIIEELIKTFRVNINNPRKFVDELRVLPLRMEDDLPIDIIFGSLPFEKRAIERASEVEHLGIDFKVITPEDLIITKIISERLKDREDVSGIIIRQGNKLDRKYLDKHIYELSEFLNRDDIWQFYEDCWKRLDDE